MSTLARVPGWVRKLDDHVGKFSEAGLNGLIEGAAVTNRLGELLARRQLSVEILDAFLSAQESPKEVDWQRLWQRVWDELLGKDVVTVLPFPTLKEKTKEVLEGDSLGDWRYAFIPQIKESDYPESFIKPNWGRYLEVKEIKRRRLPGRWVAVETIPKPNWDATDGYGKDPLANALGLSTRFSVSWEDLHETHLPATAKLIGLRKRAVRLPTAEEWNLLGNLFLWLNEHKGERLPNLGSTNSWEWCENAYCSDGRLLVGGRGRGGLADVDGRWSGRRDGGIGFRVLAVL